MNQTIPAFELHPVQIADVETFFIYEQDEEARHMAAFTNPDPTNKPAYLQHWEGIIADDDIVKRTVFVEGEVAGSLVSFMMEGQREVGYWFARAFWGKGIATAALTEFLTLIDQRPLYAHVAKDNSGSIRVLEKCGFKRHGEGSGFSHSRQSEVEEFILKLD